MLLNPDVHENVHSHHHDFIKLKAQTRLIMTLLVRNEADVVEGNIRFHLDHGVDFIIATDNGSSDGTTEILQDYVKQGVVHLLHEPSRVFQQAAWVNNMGRLALAQFGADAVFHSDADELWYPNSGSLKHELCLKYDADVLSIPIVNMVLAANNGRERFPDDVCYEVAQPISKPVQTVMKEVNWRSFLLYRYPNKIIYKTRQGHVDVVQGNHDILLANHRRNFVKNISQDIEILHFPVRGFEQFQKKIINNGEGLANLSKLTHTDPVAAWHVKRWYALYQQGRLKEEYQRLLHLDKSLKTGAVTELPIHKQKLLQYFQPVSCPR
ncbi:glycosyltransferase family 2 protein [Methylocucumis oryzae]|uniref:Glycosyltransferase 2-like domain-containing protein n=1 Tax=Methylocucumis oryzae TaxID=1632867 RepID=A0A0F3IJW4_9GAMM|nr:glycosyltransferase family 2 protein [Methylocucumis oryzae]KJV06967.1 hypothetical protein VZ94_07900 [Methylocucumis oryzae]